MTLEEIKSSDKTMLVPSDVAPVIHCDPHALRIIAHTKPETLGFPVLCIRTRTLIPREAFLAFMAGKLNQGAEA